MEQIKQMEYLRSQNDLLSQQIRDIDAYSRWSNLIFEGIPETRQENPWNKVKDILSNTMGINTSNMKIERCHGLQGSRTTPKPIIVCFNWYVDRQEIWENRRNLKGTTVYIRKDYPPDVQKVRRSLKNQGEQRLAWQCSPQHNDQRHCAEVSAKWHSEEAHHKVCITQVRWMHHAWHLLGKRAQIHRWECGDPIKVEREEHAGVLPEWGS